MRSTFVQKLLAVTALVAATAISSAAAQSDENGGKTAAGERGAASQAQVVCDGGGQEAVFTNTQNLAASTASTVFVAIPTTTLPGGPSGGDPDLYTVTFSGEADGTVGGNWEIQAQVSINFGTYTDMNPVGPDTFHTGTLQGTHTMTWCRRLTASNTNFRVVWRKNGGGSAIVDDYLMRVERSN